MCVCVCVCLCVCLLLSRDCEFMGSQRVGHKESLCDPMDCSPPGSSVHGILQARMPEWVASSFSRGSSLTQGLNLGLPNCRQITEPPGKLF